MRESLRSDFRKHTFFQGVTAPAGIAGVGVSPINPFDLQWEWPINGVSTTQLIFTATSINDQARFTMRSANGTAASPTALPAGAAIGNINFRGHDGTNFSPSGNAAITAITEEAFTPTAHGTQLVFSTTPKGTSSAPIRMKIQGDGNVGINSGGNLVNQKLEVYGGVRINSTGTAPACDANSRGTIWFELVGTADVMKVCVQTAASTYSWKTATLGP
ncbi:hypothetical protein [Geotalea uraniireducens]|uniref:hypothetical protein n=1 Tax=Geotalea uraniireducens TaxID=351604 RepID=UPI0012ED473D|nr:hypothetical protein [Geotalea uraniireducens]